MKIQKRSPILPRKQGERKPYDYQENVLSWAQGKKDIGLFMQMRLGKTLTTLRYIRRNWGIKRVLIVAPLTVLRAWAREIEEEGGSYVYLRGPRKKRETLATQGGPGFYLINYESLRTTPIIAGMEQINPKSKARNPRLRYTGVCEWDCVVLDESTRIKNPGAKVTRLCLRGFKRTKHRVILSGLPAPESPTNYWAQMAFLGKGEWMGWRSFWDWREQFFNATDNAYKPKKGVMSILTDELKKNTIALSRKAVGSTNPTVRQTLEVEMTDEQRKAFRLARDQFIKEVQETGEQIQTQWAIVRLLWMHRISGGFNGDSGAFLWRQKLDEAVSLVTGDLAGDKVVMWAHFTAEVDAIIAALEEKGVPVFGIHGKLGLKEAQRWERIDSFVEGKTRVLVAQPETMKYGVTLGNACDTAIYYSRSFGLETNRQSEDRIAIPGKPATNLILDMETVGSLDATIASRLQAKNATSETIIKELVAAVMKGDL